MKFSIIIGWKHVQLRLMLLAFILTIVHPTYAWLCPFDNGKEMTAYVSSTCLAAYRKILTAVQQWLELQADVWPRGALQCGTVS